MASVGMNVRIRNSDIASGDANFRYAVAEEVIIAKNRLMRSNVRVGLYLLIA